MFLTRALPLLCHFMAHTHTHMFDPGPVHVGYVVRKVVVGLAFLLVLQIYHVIVSPSIDRTNSHLLVTLIRKGGTR